MDSINRQSIKLQNIVLKRILRYLDDIFDDNSDYEEIPIVSRYMQIDFCKGYFSLSQYPSVLLSISLTGVNLGMLYAKEKLNAAEYDKFAIGIQFDICADEGPQCSIPSIIHTMRGIDSLFPLDACILCEFSELDGVIDAPIGVSEFRLYRLTINSVDRIVTRYYMIPFPFFE